MRYDTVIVGAGLSGLISAILLARHGRRVAVLEQHPLPAPVVRGFSRGENYFDTGFHYAGGLGEGGAFAPLFRHLGLADKLELKAYDQEGFDSLRILASGETISLPVGYRRIEEVMTARFPGAATELKRYLEQLAHGWWRFPYLDPDAAPGSFAASSVHGETLAQRLQAFADYPELQGVLSMHSLLYGVDAAATPVALNSQVAGSYYHSVHGIRGGGRALVEALLALANASGVEVMCGARVERLVTGADGVAGVLLADAELVPATEIIITCNPASLPAMVPEGALRPVYRKRLLGLRQTTSAYLLFAKAKGAENILNGRNLFIQPDAGLVTMGAEASLTRRVAYLAMTEAGAGVAASSVVAIVPALFAEVADFGVGVGERGAGYQHFKQQVSEQLLEHIQRSCPELTDLEAVALATPLTLRDYSLAPQGAIYGVGHFSGQYNPQPLTRIPGLLLSGQATAAPGFLGAVVAAYLTCGILIGHELLRKEVSLCR